MANDGQIVFEVTADGKHAIADIKEITRAIQKESGKWDAAAKESTDNINNQFSGLLKKLVAGFSAAKIGKALLDIGKEAISAASDLQEVQNVVDVTFGQGANQIEAWAKTAGTQFGLTETQAKRFTSTLGAMMKSSGLAGKEIVSMSTDLAGLAADMASFYNLDFDEAFQKIRSGISGETEPLKQLGINMSVANLEAFALQQGLDKTFNQMTQGEQTLLRYQYLMSATADAQGDFERTSDGFANAQRSIQSSLESIKTSLGTMLIKPLERATSGLSEFLSQISAEMMPERTVIDEFNDINIDTSGKMSELQETYNKAQAILDVMEKIESKTVNLNDGSTLTFGQLFSDLGNVESSGGNIETYLEGLGADVSEVVLEYDKWKEATRQLTTLVPSLTSVINTESGAIDGGTEAVQRNLDEWKAAQEKKLEWAAYYAKAQALEESKAQQYKYEFDAQAKAQLLKNFEAEHEQITKLYKEKGGFIFRDYENWGISREEAEQYKKILDESMKAEETATKQADAYAQAEAELAAGKQVLIEKYGEEEKAAEGAAEAVKGWAEETQKSAKIAVENANTALTELADYTTGAFESALSAIESTTKGFEFLGDAAQRQSKRLEPLNNELATLTENGEDLTDINLRIANEKDVFGIGNLRKNMESQLAFLREYKADMEAARAKGFSDDFLAQFADGSVESAEWLHELVGATDQQVEDLNTLYGDIGQGKKELADTLSQQNLTVDETYQTLVDKAKEAVAQLDLGQEAAENGKKTVEGLARGIADNVDGVREAVDSIVAQVARLTALGISIDVPISNPGMNWGSGWSFLPHGKTDSSNESGLDFVPRDNWIARLHEGERVLTAQENQIWNTLLNGGVAGFDLETLGGVMRDNVKAGGNVYLDGRVVGSVISDQQGRNYKSLQRSGWQQ